MGPVAGVRVMNAAAMEKAVQLVRQARRIVVFTGAGVSTESGIPDFRSPGGIWSRYDPEEFTYSRFMSSEEARRQHWQMLKETFLAYQAEPNAAHHAIAELDRRGQLDCVITQNVDGLHQKAGVPEEKVFELHGTMRWAYCLACGRRYPMEEVSAWLSRGIEVPECTSCGGTLKPAVVFFGESLPALVLAEATRRAQACDLFLVAGSSLVVYPAAYLPEYALRSGAKLIIVNLTATHLDVRAEVVLSGRAGEILDQLVRKAVGA
ncbi:MAG: Sir2 family NAD-dependent protein deacetylase [Clostridia bacterium]|nr:Sir2 family NAD-dependent protein deacetylase [Clostridia bacterium]